MPSAAIAAIAAIPAVAAASLAATPARTAAGASAGASSGSFAQALEEATPAPAGAAETDTPPVDAAEADEATDPVVADAGASAAASIDLALMTQMTAQQLPQARQPAPAAQTGNAQASTAGATGAAPTPTPANESSRQGEPEAPVDAAAAAAQPAPPAPKTAHDVTAQANAAAAAVTPATVSVAAGTGKPLADRPTPASAARGKDTPPASDDDPESAAADAAPVRPVSALAVTTHTASPAAAPDPPVTDRPVSTAGGTDTAALGLPAPLPMTANGAAIGTGAAPAAPPHQAHIAPRFDQPAFAPALGAQISVLARDGVSEARLHLNPAEMGPVSVQISVSGQAARVELVAEHALTRQVLEQSMPALAGALRESGLTLAGGGVFEQHRQPAQPDQHGGQRPGRQFANDDARADGVATPAPAVRAPVARRGVVDLYA